MALSIPDQLRNRVRASQRLQPTDDGHKDPYFDRLKASFAPTMTPATILEIARIGGTLTRDQYWAAWQEYPQHRLLLNAVAAVQYEGWAA